MIFAYHGYPVADPPPHLRRANHVNFHVRGYKEEGTTTTPFDMVMLNDLDRFHLVIDVIDRVPGLGSAPPACASRCRTLGYTRRAYTREFGEDPAEVRDWTWTGAPPVAGRPRSADSAHVAILAVNAGSSSAQAQPDRR